jgi:hypothetical protein
MAARAAVRRAAREAERREREESALAELRARARALRGDDAWAWLNGWPRTGDFTVLVGNSSRCIGCGRDRGITSVVIAEDWTPGPEPVWPLASPCRICTGLDEL